MTYSIVVVTWECAGHLARLVDSMEARLAERPELVVVDNASSDDPDRAAGRWSGPVSFSRLERNVGFGAAANDGVARAGSDAIVLLNPDTELLDSRLGELAAFALERRALAGPRLVEPDGRPQPSASGPEVGVWPWIRALVPGALQPSAIQASTEPWRLERSARVSWLSGACLAAPRAALVDLGPFDPEIHLYGEDMDLGLRAAAAGVESWFRPDLCRVLHHGRGSTSRRWPQGPAETMERNRRAVLLRSHGRRAERAAWLARRLNLRLRVLAKRAAGRDPAWEATLLRAARAARSAPALPAAPRAPG